jgi:hypothetical protein
MDLVRVSHGVFEIIVTLFAGEKSHHSAQDL